MNIKSKLLQLLLVGVPFSWFINSLSLEQKEIFVELGVLFLAIVSLICFVFGLGWAIMDIATYLKNK